MDRRWPWKKKTSDKDQDKTKTIQYVQVSAESYAHLNELETQVKVLNENLSSAQSEMTSKENLVKQHAKVAEEAIAGWEKAEAETLALKQQLESVTLLKLTAEDRAARLDDALKECLKEIRNVKEESEQILHDTIFANTKQREALKSELESKIFDLEQELLRNSAENASLSRSLQERSNLLMRISEEKSRAEAEIEDLKSDIRSCEREINSLKYEVHVVTKELEIRNEEKNMSVRLAESANKQHIEDAKKIAKLESECQRLRVLVKKKLPGPAALAQMKLEVEGLGWDYGDSRVRRSPVKGSSNTYLSLPPSFSLEEMQQCQKENGYLTAQLLAAEEETKMLKEALSKRNSELRESRSISQRLVLNQQKNHFKLDAGMSLGGSFSLNHSNPSLTSVSEDGIDEEGSCSESCSTVLMSEILQLKHEKNNVDQNNKQMELMMDDFLEMERLACSSTESKPMVNNENYEGTSLSNVVHKDGNNENQSRLGESTNNLVFIKLKSRIISLVESLVPNTDARNFLEDIRQSIQVIQDEFPQNPALHSRNAPSEEGHRCEDKGEADDRENSIKNEMCSNKYVIDEGLANAISTIHAIIVPLCKDALEIQDSLHREKVEEFSASINKVISSEINLHEFIIALSCILSTAQDARFNMLTHKGSEGESNSNDWIDKLTLLEKRVAQYDPSKSKLLGESEDANSQSPTSAESQNSYIEFERIKQEKAEMEVEVGRCTENYENAKLQLVEMEQQIAEAKSQLSACQKSNSLADTQLKCMAESYKSLESRALQMETEMNILQSKMESLDNELQEERRSHRYYLAKCSDLQEQIEREKKCSMCSFHSEAEIENKTKQDREIAAATEKLAECQETIILLGRHLQAMQPPPVPNTSSPNHNNLRLDEHLMQVQLSPNGNLSIENDDASSVIERTGEGYDAYNSYLDPCEMETSIPILKGQKKQRSRSASSSSLSSMLNEKQSRGFSRFFSKGKRDR